MTTRKTAKTIAPAAESGEWIDRLGEMTLSELRARFAEVVGETTRSPNKTHLLRRIREAVAAAAAPAKETEAAAPEGGDAGGDAEPLSDVPAVPEPTDGPDRAPQTEAADGNDRSRQPVDDAATLPSAWPKLLKLDIPALQAKYRETLGRDTTSENRGYLVWKIRQAERGKVPTGPRNRARAEGATFKVLPLRLESELVDLLDEAWLRLGLHSRMDLFRIALKVYLAGAGENELAERLAPGA